MPLKPLGRIVRLQIQPAPLKLGEKPNRRYDPSALRGVSELTLTREGATARTPEGETVLDIHHARHPHTRNHANTNPLSIGFSAHYDLMRAEYGEQLWTGCAGETIIVENLQRIKLDDVAAGIAIVPQNGGAAVWLTSVAVARPCLPFSGYVLGGTEALVKTTLQFLDDGLRGFYCALEQDAPAPIAVGDNVFVEV
jgi:hypothetical protein